MLRRPEVGFVILLALVMLHVLWHTSTKGHFYLGASALAVIAIFTAVTVRWGPTYALFLPPPAISLFLCLLFGKTLLPGNEPLVTRIARLERGELSPDLIAYTRRVTWVWTGFLLLVTLESTFLAIYTSVETWSLFANILNYAFIGALFTAEYIYRINRFGRAGHASLWRVLSRIGGQGIGTL
jgi:uncharacterized membrane protein